MANLIPEQKTFLHSEESLALFNAYHLQRKRLAVANGYGEPSEAETLRKIIIDHLGSCMEEKPK